MSQSLYDLLEIPQNAGDTEILAAFQRLTQRYATQASGLSAADTDSQIRMTREAYVTLSDYARRSAYDASLSANTPPTRLEVAIHEPRWSAKKIMLILIGSLIVIGMALQIGFMLLNSRHADSSLAEVQESIVRMREHEIKMEQTMLSGEFAGQQTEDERRLEYAAQQRASALEESRRYAASITDALTDARISADAQAKQQAEDARAEQQRSKDEAEAAIRNRLEAEKERLHELESQNNR